MNISNTQSHSSILSVVSSRTIISSSSAGSGQSISARAGDLLDLSNQIDPGFARSVLQDTVEKRLETALQDAGLDISAQEILSQKGDQSPQATADRIVQFATSFFEPHKATHVDLESKRQVEEFASLIREAVETGFEEAGSMLSQLGQIPGAVQADMDETLELVMKGIDDFANDKLAAIDAQQTEVEDQDATTAI